MDSNIKDIVKLRSIDNYQIVILEELVLVYREIKQSDRFMKEDNNNKQYQITLLVMKMIISSYDE